MMEKSIYSNALMINVSPYDISIQFNTMDPANPADTGDSIRVFLSPQHAKLFSLLLEKNIKTFEDFSGGEIKLPEDLIKNVLGNGGVAVPDDGGQTKPE